MSTQKLRELGGLFIKADSRFKGLPQLFLMRWRRRHQQVTHAYSKQSLGLLVHPSSGVSGDALPSQLFQDGCQVFLPDCSGFRVPVQRPLKWADRVPIFRLTVFREPRRWPPRFRKADTSARATWSVDSRLHVRLRGVTSFRRPSSQLRHRKSRSNRCHSSRGAGCFLKQFMRRHAGRCLNRVAGEHDASFIFTLAFRGMALSGLLPENAEHSSA